MPDALHDHSAHVLRLRAVYKLKYGNKKAPKSHRVLVLAKEGLPPQSVVAIAPLHRAWLSYFNLEYINVCILNCAQVLYGGKTRTTELQLFEFSLLD